MSMDSKALKRYHASVERALGLFDASNEWADYIAFLSRLVKALQASPPGADVPLKTTLAKYLAQCLQPSLPSGVHQKALETYKLVFSLLGSDGLSRDLSVYLPGISHTLTFASLSIRPLFLSLFEDHILKLSSKVVRPALKAIILSLLPGIEEENSEEFERTIATFNKLRELFIIGGYEELFWQSLFLASITNASRRGGVLVYLSRYLPKFGRQGTTQSAGYDAQTTEQAQTPASRRIVTKPEPGMLIRCFATGLQDEQALTQRGFLDLLVLNLPISSLKAQDNVSPSDLDVLVLAAMTVVLRRDMSLNRRLWSWFTGSEDVPETPAEMVSPSIEKPPEISHLKGSGEGKQSDYFRKYGLDAVIRCFQKLLESPPLTPSDRARPYRILLSMMDRWEIGGPIVQTMFIPLMKNLLEYQTTAPSQEAFDEVYRSANVFFEGIEPLVIAIQLFQLLEREDYGLVEFVISNFNLHEDELIATHMPMFALVVSWKLLRISEQFIIGDRSTRIQDASIQMVPILDIVLDLLPAQPVGEFWSISDENPDEDTLNQIPIFYGARKSLSCPTEPPFEPGVVNFLILRNVAVLISNYFEDLPAGSLLAKMPSIFEKVMAHINGLQALQNTGIIERLSIWIERATDLPYLFEIVKTMTSLIGIVRVHDIQQETLTEDELFDLVPKLVTHLWNFLHPQTPQFHVESVDLIWNLRSLSTDLHIVDSLMMSLIMDDEAGKTDQDHFMDHFAVFWSHTRSTESKAGNPPAVSSTQNHDTPWSLLCLPLLHIIDEADLTRRTDRYMDWLNGLQSMRPLFMVILQDIEAKKGDDERLIVSLYRLSKLANITRLSAVQWKDFHDITGPGSSILEFCTLLITQRPSETDLVLEALQTLKACLEGMQGPLSMSIYKSLISQISNKAYGITTQGAIIDTVKMVFSLPNPNEPTTELFQTLIQGISNNEGDSNIDKCISLLCTTVPLYSPSTFFANLLKTTACFCDRISTYFDIMRQLFAGSKSQESEVGRRVGHLAQNPDRSITNLFTGLEFILARAHTQIMNQPRPSSDGSVMTANDLPQSRSVANTQLTVILCMQDAIRVCVKVWSWHVVNRSESTSLETKSFSYNSSRLRSRTRRFLEHLIDAEPQESMETLMGIWVESAKSDSQQSTCLDLLQSLEGARPKFMMPATFNAIFSRTNPAALDQTQKSSLSVDVSGLELIAFLTAYVNALEDDLLEEIWADCTTFLREVLANPMPHRQLLLRMLEFVAVLCQKMENTNFGEQSRMRRELADLCSRLFTAIFTIKPGGLDSTWGRSDGREIVDKDKSQKVIEFDAGNPISLLSKTLPLMGGVLVEFDRLVPVYSGVAINIIGPILRSRLFPQNTSPELLSLLQVISKIPAMNKTWRKDVLEAFNDSRFFQSPVSLAQSGWTPLVKQLSLTDKALMGDLLSRLTPPSSAGLMFGVGASAARSEADKRTQLHLRRISFLLLSTEIDVHIGQFGAILPKLEELLSASPNSSPSSNTRGELFILIRALTLAFSTSYLVSLWPVLDSELRILFSTILDRDESIYNDFSKFQGAKLLDLLLVLKPEEFQLHEWIFVTDTIDAIYPSKDYTSIALADNISAATSGSYDLSISSNNQAKRPWLCNNALPKPEDLNLLLKSFCTQLSIHAFEDAYSLKPVDVEACRHDLLTDIFADGQ